jgi:spoIIIJ-associated protein
VEGNDLGVLIGPRGETLNALQHVSRLMTGHKLHQRPNFIVDVEGYRSRREKALARLADRMAKKVVARGKALNLEPMPPNERRIIHMTLRDHDEVFTQSRGEGDQRQVRILLKK